YSAVSGMPPNAQLEPQTGQFRWTPGFENAGDYLVRFQVSDAAGLSDTTDVAIHVNNVDRAPTLSVSNHATILGKTLSFQLTGGDPDAGTTLTYSAVGLPQGATLDPITGHFSWTPGPLQAADYVINFSVSDGELATTQAALLRATLAPV